MADVKWIKLAVDLFDDEKILLIESMPDSYSLIIVWIKLLCLAGKQNNSGVFTIGNRAYTPKMLATIFRMKETSVELALKVFEEFGMVETVNGVLTIPNWGKHQTLDSIESRNERQKKYMREYRSRQKELASGKANSKTNCKANSKTNVSSLEGEGEGDKDKDKDILCIGAAEPVQPVLSIPLNDGTEYPISEEDIQLWSGLYPAVDVLQELRNMVGWSNGNPSKRKTRRGVRAFICRWLATEQDKGGRQYHTQSKQQKLNAQYQTHDQIDDMGVDDIQRMFARRAGQEGGD